MSYRRMFRYVSNRLITSVVMALFATLVMFLIASLVPGDPILAQLGDLAASKPEIVAEYRANWGLDLPLWEQYWIFLQRLFHGDLGISISTQRPVLDDIAQYAPATIELATIAFLLSIAIGVPLGIVAAVWRDSWIDHGARFISLVGVSAPTFWLAFIVLAIFYGGLQIAPGPGRLDPIDFPAGEASPGLFLIDSLVAGDWETFTDCRRAPGLAVDRAVRRDARPHHAHDARQHAGDAGAGLRARRARQRAEGARVSCGHALPNALIPVVTLGGLAYANLLTGAVMTETIFSWPGLGRYTFRSAAVARFSGDHGHHADRRDRVSGHQSPGRPVLRAARSAGAEAMSEPLRIRCRPGRGASRSRRGDGTRGRRWLRRYGLAALGAADHRCRGSWWRSWRRGSRRIAPTSST